jgi:aquaporin Z
MVRRLVAEFLGTTMLVFIGVGAATLVFGFHEFGFKTAGSVAAGVLSVGMAFGLILLALVYVIGPISACHVNPAVTLGAVLARRIGLAEAAGYWAAQFAGGIIGALVLWWLLTTSPIYHKSVEGLGTNGWGSASFLHITAGGAFLAEVVLTGIFVFVVLTVSRPGENKAIAGVPIGLTLTVVHIFGIAIDGTSVNPARSLGPALITGGQPLRQLWLFIVAPLVGAALAAVAHILLFPSDTAPSEKVASPRPPVPAGSRPT